MNPPAARSRAGARLDHAAAKPRCSDDDGGGPYASCSLSSSAMVSRLLGTFPRRMTDTTCGGATSVTNLAGAGAFAIAIGSKHTKTITVSIRSI